MQVNLQAGVPQPQTDITNGSAEDDIDAALLDLQVTLEGTNINNGGDITHVPELFNYLRFLK